MLLLPQSAANERERRQGAAIYPAIAPGRLDLHRFELVDSERFREEDFYFPLRKGHHVFDNLCRYGALHRGLQRGAIAKIHFGNCEIWGGISLRIAGGAVENKLLESRHLPHERRVDLNIVLKKALNVAGRVIKNNQLGGHPISPAMAEFPAATVVRLLPSNFGEVYSQMNCATSGNRR